MPHRHPEADGLLEQGLKRCGKCKNVKPLDDFHKGGSIDGKASNCKSCACKLTREWREKLPDYKKHHKEIRSKRLDHYRKMARKWEGENRAKRLRQNRDRRANNPAVFLEYRRRYELRHPDKSKARREVTYCVAKNLIDKPSHCPKCGSKTPNNDMHGHHEDYSLPLHVEWMCRTCHAKLHANRKGHSDAS